MMKPWTVPGQRVVGEEPRTSEVLVHFDGPDLVLIRSPSETRIALAVDQDMKAIRWLEVPVTATELTALRIGAESLREAFVSRSQVIVTVTDLNGVVTESWQSDPNELPDWSLPDAGFFLSDLVDPPQATAGRAFSFERAGLGSRLPFSAIAAVTGQVQRVWNALAESLAATELQRAGEADPAGETKGDTMSEEWPSEDQAREAWDAYAGVRTPVRWFPWSELERDRRMIQHAMRLGYQKGREAPVNVTWTEVKPGMQSIRPNPDQPSLTFTTSKEQELKLKAAEDRGYQRGLAEGGGGAVAALRNHNIGYAAGRADAAAEYHAMLEAEIDKARAEGQKTGERLGSFAKTAEWIDALKHERDAGRKAERDAVVAWLRAQRSAVTAIDGPSALTIAYAVVINALNNDAHHRTPEPTPEQSRSAVVERIAVRMARAELKATPGPGEPSWDGMLPGSQESWLRGSRSAFAALSPAAQEAEIQAEMARQP